MTAKQRDVKLQSTLDFLYSIRCIPINLAKVLLRDIGNGLDYILSPAPKVSHSGAVELQVSCHDPPNADPSLIGV